MYVTSPDVFPSGLQTNATTFPSSAPAMTPSSVGSQWPPILIVWERTPAIDVVSSLLNAVVSANAMTLSRDCESQYVETFVPSIDTYAFLPCWKAMMRSFAHCRLRANSTAKVTVVNVPVNSTRAYRFTSPATVTRCAPVAVTVVNVA